MLFAKTKGLEQPWESDRAMSAGCTELEPLPGRPVALFPVTPERERRRTSLVTAPDDFG
jgi:hypothetical protein